MVQHNCEGIVLTAMRQALDRAYEMLNTEGPGNPERMQYWRGRIEGIEEGIRIFQSHNDCPTKTGVGPRFFA
ncbi:MAG: hypothetical protein GY751_26375 [Bacteroidetes bacterium]|jgi:hypothetical protein|nr:hypothetical protein [Bacteroidota bacterium]